MPPIFAVAIIVFLEIVALGSTIIALPLFTKSLGGSIFYIGILFALVTAPKVILNPIWGAISDKIGRRSILLLGILGSLAAAILWLLSSNLILLTASRVVGGIFAAQAAMAYAVAADTTTPERRAAAMGLLGAAFGFGMTLGLPLGGIIGNFSFTAIGWIGIVCQTLALLVLFFLKETRPEPAATAEGNQPHTGSIHLSLTKIPRVRLVLAVVLLLTLAMAVLFPTLSLLTEAWFGWTIRQTSYAFAIWGFIGIIVQGGLIRPIVKRIGESNTIRVGGLFLAVGLACYAIMPLLASPSRPLFWCGIILVGIGGALAVPATSSLISIQVDESKQGAAQGLNQSATSLGRAFGYIPATALLGAFGPTAPYLSATTAALIAVILLTILASYVGLRVRSAAESS